MARLDGGGRVRVCALALAWTAVLAQAALAPAMAEQGAAVRYAVTLTELERFEGEVAAAALVCRSTFACSGQARMEVLGWPHEYALFTLASDTRLLLFFRRTSSRTPALNHGWGNPIEIALAPDGAGRQHAALEAFLPSPRHPV